MTFWQFLDKTIDRFPGWPTERQWVTIWTFVLILILLAMARADRTLWEVEVFKVIVQAVVLTGALNMILAFHFAANKADEVRASVDAKRADNTGKALDANARAIEALSNGTGDAGAAGAAADQVADAAAQEADAIKDATK